MKNEVLPEILSFERWVAVIDRVEKIFLRRLKELSAAEAARVASEWAGEVASQLAFNLHALHMGTGGRSLYPSARVRLFVRTTYLVSTERVVFDCSDRGGKMLFEGAVSAGFTRVLHLALERDFITPGDLILLNSMTADHPKSERANYMARAKRAEAQVERET